MPTKDVYRQWVHAQNLRTYTTLGHQGLGLNRGPKLMNDETQREAHEVGQRLSQDQENF